MRCWSTTVRSVPVLVSTTRAWPLTVTVSVTAPTRSTTSSRTSSLTRTSTSGERKVWKPGELGRDRVAADRQAAQRIEALVVAGGLDGRVGTVVGGADGGARDDGAGSVADDADDGAGRGLGVGWTRHEQRGGQHDEGGEPGRGHGASFGVSMQVADDGKKRHSSTAAARRLSIETKRVSFFVQPAAVGPDAPPRREACRTG